MPDTIYMRSEVLWAVGIGEVGRPVIFQELVSESSTKFVEHALFISSVVFSFFFFFLILPSWRDQLCKEVKPHCCKRLASLLCWDSDVAFATQSKEKCRFHKSRELGSRGFLTSSLGAALTCLPSTRWRATSSMGTGTCADLLTALCDSQHTVWI